jgi:anaerobic ribonucleoside-triphosphate reductase activating protein
VGEILTFVARHPDIDGVTISGGEPLDQAGELMALLRGLRELFPVGSRVDLLVYTGRPRQVVEHAFAPVLALADVWAVGPYRAAEPTNHPLLGSANQELLLLTELGRSRYASYARTGQVEPMPLSVGPWPRGLPGRQGDVDEVESAPLSVGRRPRRPDAEYGQSALPVGESKGSGPGRRLVQVSRSGDHYWTVGIPAAGDLEALEAAAAAQGVVLDQASWRAGEP